MRNVLDLVRNIPSLPRIDPSRDLVLAAAGSASPTEPPLAAASANLARLAAGVATEIAVVNAWVPRLPVIPAPPAAPTLQQLVSRARAQLLSAQQTARSAELTGIQQSASDLQAALK